MSTWEELRVCTCHQPRAAYPHPAVCTNIVPCSAPRGPDLTGRHGCWEMWWQWALRSVFIIFFRREKFNDFVFHMIYLWRKKGPHILDFMYCASRWVPILRVAGLWLGVVLIIGNQQTQKLFLQSKFSFIFLSTKHIRSCPLQCSPLSSPASGTRGWRHRACRCKHSPRPG